MSDSLRPHEPQHARPPCPSPTPGVHPNPCPLCQWCHPTISSSVVPFSSCSQSLPASESFPMSQLFAWGGQSTGVSAWASFLPKKWCFWTVVLEKTLESPLDSKEIQPVHSKGNQSEYSLQGLMPKLKLLILWPPDVKSLLFRKDPDAGKDWRQEVKGMTQNDMVGWHHQLNGYQFEQTPGDGEGLGSLACCSPWGCKDGTTEQQQQQ